MHPAESEEILTFHPPRYSIHAAIRKRPTAAAQFLGEGIDTLEQI